MVDARTFQGGMNMDAAPELLRAGDYAYALNIQNGIEGVLNLPGNRTITPIAAPVSGTDWVCGRYEDRTRQRVLYFLFNSAGYHRIIAVGSGTESSIVLFENKTDTAGIDILEWGTDAVKNPEKLIKDIKVVHRDFGGDLVYFIDPLKRPLKFNYDSLLGGDYGDLTLQMIKVIKYPSAKVPVCIYKDDATRNVNNLKKKLFKFAVRYVYDDDEKSVVSSPSKVPLPPKADDGAYYADGTKANYIEVILNTGISTVKKIEILGKVNIENVWSDYFVVDTLDKDILSIDDETSYSYSFYNDGSYVLADIEESELLFDYVPDEANALETANGNILVYGGIKEGNNKEVSLDVAATVTSVAPTGLTLDYVLVSSSPAGIRLNVIGTVTTGDQFTINFNITDTTIPTVINVSETYTAIGGDDADDVINGLCALLLASYSAYIGAVLWSPGSGQILIASNSDDFVLEYTSFVVNSTTTIGDSDSISALKWKGRYKYGVAYFRNDGKTRGVYIMDDDSLSLDMPAYSEVTSEPQVPKVSLSITNAPPSWADYFHIVRSDELTSAFSLFVQTKANKNGATDYPLLNIQNIVATGDDFPAMANIVTYDFVEGDRVRFLKNVSTSTVISPSVDYEILGVVEDSGDRYIKIKKVTGQPSLTNDTDRMFIEIFRPKPVVSSEENVYYEIGERYDIYTDANGNRSHMGNTQNQTIGAGAQPAIIDMTMGDYYYKERVMVSTTTGNYTSPFGCMDKNFSDFWLSGVWGQGRPLVIDESIREQYFPGLLRFSLAYQQGTNINLLSRFYPENFEEADVSFGDILRLKTRENFIRMFQRYKTAMIPIYRQIFTDTAGSSQVALSERLLNKPNYYAGDYGIDRYGSSLISTDFGDYFIDTINKALVRVSIDGITNVSDLYGVAGEMNTALDVDTYGFGAFNYERRVIMMGYGNIVDGEPVQKIIGFNENEKRFETFYGFNDALELLFVNGKIWAFTTRPYIHDSATRNNFFGVQQSSVITPVFNKDVILKKTYTAIEELSTSIWTAVITTGEVLDQETNLVAGDFQKAITGKTYNSKEGKFNATIKRDINSVGGKYFGDTMKGCFAQVELTNSDTTAQRLISVSLKYIQSQLTNQ